MEKGSESEGGDAEGTLETPTASSGGDSSENATYVLSDNLTSLNEESGPHAMKLDRSWYSKSKDRLNPSEEPNREVSLQGNPVERHVQADGPPLSSNNAGTAQIPPPPPPSPQIAKDIASTAEQEHPQCSNMTRVTGREQPLDLNFHSTDVQQSASRTRPDQSHGPNMSSTPEQQAAGGRGPDHSPRSEASPHVTQSTEATRARSNQSLGQNTTSRHIRSPSQSGTIEEPSSSLDVPPMNVQPPGTSETRAIPPVDQGDSETRTNQPADQAVSPMPVSPPESSVHVPTPRKDTSELQSSSKTSEGGIKPTKQDTEPTEETTSNQSKGGCSTGIEMLIEHSGDDTKAIGIKEEILFELCPTRCTFRMSSICGVLHHCLPDMEQWRKDKLMNSESRTPHETSVHNVIRELKNHGVTIGQAVQYFMQGQNKRVDIVSLINKIHHCDFCAALKSK